MLNIENMEELIKQLSCIKGISEQTVNDMIKKTSVLNLSAKDAQQLIANLDDDKKKQFYEILNEQR